MLHENYLQRCIDLASRGLGKVAPNPLVGAVVVYNETIIGEGFHEVYGGAHAEVNALQSVQDKNLIADSTLYVNLEPCSHHGKTPPCADLIIEKKIKKVVIGTADPFPAVSGRGIEKLRSAGIEVITGILEKECRELNRFFFTYYSYNRPFIILKWAQTADGFIAPLKQSHKQPLKISNSEAQTIVHQWRSTVQAILVGKHTVLKDDPQLNVRLVEGKNPIPFILASPKDIPSDYKIWASNPVFFESKNRLIEKITDYCLKNKIQSILVEGGAKTLQCFIDCGFWDEAIVITNTNMHIHQGLAAPLLMAEPYKKMVLGPDVVNHYIHPASHV